jgi:recombination protein RecT
VSWEQSGFKYFGDAKMTDKEIVVQPKKQVTVRSYMRSEEIMQYFKDILGDHQAQSYVSSVLLAVANSDALQQCSPQSITSSAIRAASLHLSCDPAMGQAYIVPFKGSATLIVGYRGIYQMALRTNQYRYIQPAKVFEGEEVIENRITGWHEIHVVGPVFKNKVIGYVLYFELVNGFQKSFYMSAEEIESHAQKYSKSYGRSDSPWKTNLEDMQKKTILRLGLMKWGVFDPHDVAMMGVMDEEVANDMLPAVEEVKVEEPEPPQTEHEIMQQLGFETVVKEKPKKLDYAALWPKNAKVSYESAAKIVAGNGTKYVNLNPEQMKEASVGLEKLIRDPKYSQEDRDFCQMKLDALSILRNLQTEEKEK